MTSEAVLQAVRAWAKARLGLDDSEVRVEPSNGVVGSSPYLTVQVVDDEEAWTTEVVRSYPGGGDTTESWTPRSTRRTTVRLEGYGAGSREWLRVLSTWWLVGDPAGLTLRASGVVPAQSGTVRQVPLLLSTAWTERARVDLACYADATDDPATGIATAASVALDLEDADDIVSTTTTIPLE